MQSVQGPPYRPYPTPPAVPRYNRPAPRAASARPIELFAALALVGLADFAFWPGANGLGYGYGTTIFFFAVPALVILASRLRRPSVRLYVIATMVVAVAVRCLFAPTPGTVLSGLAGVFAVALVIRQPSSRISTLLGSALATMVTPARRFFAFGSGLRRVLGGGRMILGIVVPIALVAVFATLFALANPVVASGMKTFLAYLVFPSAARMALWVGLLGGAALLLRPAVRRARSRAIDTPVTEATETGISISRNTLFALNVLFLAYNAVDARYLWAGSPPSGMSERTYAHMGTLWLTVTMLCLTGVVGFMFRGGLAWDTRARWTRILAFAWLGQGLVIALGTYRRLMIHVVTSGLSSLRILGMFGTTLVVAGLVMVGLKLLHRRNFSWLFERQVDGFAAALVVFALLPTHWIAARANIDPVMRHDYQSLVHVEEQAREAESAAALLPLVHHDDERIRRGMAALLLNERDALQARTSKPWRTQNLSTAMTLSRLDAAAPELEEILGDVERPDAIRQFEYIRNSSIEGEIAQSEINRVEFAPTRPEKVARDYEGITLGSLEERPTVTTVGDQSTVVLHLARWNGARTVTLDLERTNGTWQVKHRSAD